MNTFYTIVTIVTCSLVLAALPNAAGQTTGRLLDEQMAEQSEVQPIRLEAMPELPRASVLKSSSTATESAKQPPKRSTTRSPRKVTPYPRPKLDLSPAYSRPDFGPTPSLHLAVRPAFNETAYDTDSLESRGDDESSGKPTFSNPFSLHFVSYTSRPLRRSTAANNRPQLSTKRQAIRQAELLIVPSIEQVSPIGDNLVAKIDEPVKNSELGSSAEVATTIPYVDPSPQPIESPKVEQRVAAITPPTAAKQPTTPSLSPVTSNSKPTTSKSVSLRSPSVNMRALTERVESHNYSVAALEQQLTDQDAWDANTLQQVLLQIERIKQDEDLLELYWNVLESKRQRRTGSIVSTDGVFEKLRQRVFEAKVETDIYQRSSRERAEIMNALEDLDSRIESLQAE